MSAYAQRADFGPAGVYAHGTDHVAGANESAKGLAGRQALGHAPNGVPTAKVVGAFTAFDVPGAGTDSFQGTFPAAINPEGAITGYYFDSAYVSHGFLRSSSGAFTTFDAPGAVNGTNPATVNPQGTIAGTFYDANLVVHGFVRARGGTVATFDVPGASTASFQGTSPIAINAQGAIAGTYLDANSVQHGFVRYSNGTISAFDAPGAVNGTQAVAISPTGVIAGIYTDANSRNHGFLRASNGAFTTFDPPGQINVFAPFSFGPDLYVNENGVITGTYFATIAGNPFGGNYRVFVMARDGSFTTFDAATYPPCCIWSFPSGINPAQAITGSFNDGFSINHGFVRAGNGIITTFDAPAAGSGSNQQGTVPLGITPNGLIMGEYIDANYTYHGFLRAP